MCIRKSLATVVSFDSTYIGQSEGNSPEWPDQGIGFVYNDGLQMESHVRRGSRSENTRGRLTVQAFLTDLRKFGMSSLSLPHSHPTMILSIRNCMGLDLLTKWERVDNNITNPIQFPLDYDRHPPFSLCNYRHIPATLSLSLAISSGTATLLLPRSCHSSSLLPPNSPPPPLPIFTRTIPFSGDSGVVDRRVLAGLWFWLE